MTGGSRPLSPAGATLSLVGAAFGFATIAIFTTLATGAGTPLLTVLAGRYVVATVILAVVAGGFAALRLPARRVALLAGLGGATQAIIAFLSLSSLRFISAATLVFLFYTFPAWVALFAAMKRTERLTPMRLASLALSSLGVVAMVGLPGADAVHPVGAALALSSAVIYALFIPFINRLQANLSPVVATWWVAVGAAFIFAGSAAFGGQLTLRQAPLSWLSILGLGAFSTATAFVLFLRGLAVVGPVRTAIITTAEPFFVSLLAAVVLGQPVRLATLAGGMLIAMAVLLLQRGPQSGT